jgi:hypothetical protein
MRSSFGGQRSIQLSYGCFVVHLADRRCVGNGPARADWARSKVRRQRSHVRIVSGAPGKAGAERAGTVAGKIFEPRPFRHLYVNSTAGRPGVRIERTRDGIAFKILPLSGHNGHAGGHWTPVQSSLPAHRSGVVLDFRSVYIARRVPVCSPPIRRQKQKASDAWRLSYFNRRVLRLESKICL